MADVRLTATNPDDSTVVPVACNAKGELKLEEPPEFDGTLDGDLTVTGNATFDGQVEIGNDIATASGTRIYRTGAVYVRNDVSQAGEAVWKTYTGGFGDANVRSVIYQDGAAEFKGDSFLIGNYTFNSTTTSGAEFDAGSLTLQRLGSVASNSRSIAGRWGGDIKWEISVDGNATFDGTVNSDGWFESQRTDGSYYAFRAGIQPNPGSNTGFSETVRINASGDASFSGEVVVTSRGQKWTLVEAGGLCHMVALTRSAVDPGFAVDVSVEPEYPELRDVFKELDMIESALQEVMERLRMAPPSGWEVWDGSDT